MKSSSYAIICIVAFIVLLLHSHNVNGSSNNINCSGENNLREGWFEYYSDEEERAYYYNAKTKETTWTYPYEKCNSDSNGLPHGWKRLYSEDVGEYYYVNTKTNENQWLKPVDSDMARFADY